MTTRRSFIARAGEAFCAVVAAVYVPGVLVAEVAQNDLVLEVAKEFGPGAICMARLRDLEGEWETKELTKRTPDGGWIIAEDCPDGYEVVLDWIRIEEPRDFTVNVPERRRNAVFTT